MISKELIQICKDVAERFNLDPKSFAAFIEVESGGKGFNNDGKIIIQFEPSWMKKMAPYTPSGIWSVNKIDVQSKEWIAFSDAFKKNADAAMKATSIGLGQIMGFHYKRLGFATVGEMWDHAKKGLKEQVEQIALFIISDSKLLTALKNKDWHTVASIYNGSGYLALAKRIKREPYNISLRKAYERYENAEVF
jgi:hypothetical protein